MKPSKYQGRIGYQTKNHKEYKYSEESRTISGYAAVFNNVDKAGDKLIKGCFAKSINDRGPVSAANDKIMFLWMHDMKEPIGKITLLKEDDHGLYFEAEIDNIPLGDRCIEQFKSGTLNQFSIGFNYVWDKCEFVEVEGDMAAYFECKELILHEISVVSIGCNGETEFLGFKDGTDVYEEFQKEVSATIKETPNKTEIMKLITKAYSLGKLEPNKSLKQPEPKAEAKSIFSNVKLL